MDDLSGKVFGRLTVISYAGDYKWNCICSCGSQKAVRGSDLRSGRTTSCGCLRKEALLQRFHTKLTGERFGRLVVESFYDTNNRNTLWKCKCDCGKEVIVKGTYLVNGDTKSCGCLKRDRTIERNTTHGMAHQTRLYTVWKGMRERCYNVNCSEYQNYGGRGVTICPEWDDFSCFAQWAEENGYNESLPASECSIDRIDNNGIYEPSNCRWVSMSQQARNTRRNRLLFYDGQVKPAVEWGEIYGINSKNITQRIDKYGWSVADAITTPVLRGGIKHGH